MFTLSRFVYAKMYSLMEIIIVFVIIGVLSTLAFVGFRFSETVVTDDLANNVLKSVELAQREYFLQRGSWLTDPNLLASFVPNTEFASPAINPYSVSLVTEPFLDSFSLGVAVLTDSNNCLTLRLSPEGKNVEGSYEVTSEQQCSGRFA